MWNWSHRHVVQAMEAQHHDDETAPVQGTLSFLMCFVLEQLIFEDTLADLWLLSGFIILVIILKAS